MRPQNPYSLAAVMAFLNNNFAIVILAVVMFAAGFFLGSMWTENQLLKNGTGVAAAPSAALPTDPSAVAPSGPTKDQLAQVPAVTDEDMQRGSTNPKITLIEYSDFECPFCQRFHPTMQQVMDEYGDQVQWVYRHYPLSFHPNAQKAAEAAECVNKVGGETAFWKYADAVFEENSKLGGTLTPEAIKTAAQAAGVNMSSFQTCLDSGEMADKVSAQASGGSSAGVSGTPGTIIVTEDGAQEMIPGALPFEQVKPMLDKYL
ncbi:MAG TPA: thioredoxin domain-containing protein [Vitreimonas sp.]|nr:thioredoxin domain-containing protein [Vitreimonas sp.]